MSYEINYGSRAFCVPAAVSDHFLRLANAVQLRVLLYLIRNENAGTAQAASFLRISEEEAEEAAQFWVQAGILGNSGTDFPFAAPEKTAAAAPSASAVPAVQAEPSAPQASTVRSSKEIKLDPSEIAHELEQSKSLKDLFAFAEKLFGRPLMHMEQRSLLWLREYQGMASEVILTLLGYCKTVDKLNMGYAEAIALRWITDGILTLSQAEEEIKQMTRSHSFTTQIRKMFQMQRTPTSKQKELIEKWQTAGYSLPLIGYAYEITIESIDKLNFKYIDTILSDWVSKGISTPEQAMELRRSGNKAKQKNQQKNQQEMSADELAKMEDYLSLVNNFGEE